MNCPYCGGELRRGALTLRDNEPRAAWKRVYVLTFRAEGEGEAPVELRFENEKQEAWYCPACRKAMAAFEKGYNLPL